MRFLLDENADIRLAAYLERFGHDVKVVARDYPPSIPDEQILMLAHEGQRVLITNDLDFSELVFQKALPHTGVILFRLLSVDIVMIIDRLSYVLTHHADQLDQFVVVTEKRVRVRKTPSP